MYFCFVSFRSTVCRYIKFQHNIALVNSKIVYEKDLGTYLVITKTNARVIASLSLLLTSVPSLILINFLIPKIPKTDLGSPQIVESDGTLEIAKTSNVPHFYTYFINQKFLVQL